MPLSTAIVAIDCSCRDAAYETLVSVSPWNTFKLKKWPFICPWVSILFHVNLRYFSVLGDFRLSTAFPAFENMRSASVHWLTFLWTRAILISSISLSSRGRDFSRRIFFHLMNFLPCVKTLKLLWTLKFLELWLAILRCHDCLRKCAKSSHHLFGTHIE